MLWFSKVLRMFHRTTKCRSSPSETRIPTTREQKRPESRIRCPTVHACILILSKEFSKLSEDANIYKLVGPILLKQDTTEAKSTVEGRLDFIEKEM